MSRQRQPLHLFKSGALCCGSWLSPNELCICGVFCDFMRPNVQQEDSAKKHNLIHQRGDLRSIPRYCKGEAGLDKSCHNPNEWDEIKGGKISVLMLCKEEYEPSERKRLRVHQLDEWGQFQCSSSQVHQWLSLVWFHHLCHMKLNLTIIHLAETSQHIESRSHEKILSYHSIVQLRGFSLTTVTRRKEPWRRGWILGHVWALPSPARIGLVCSGDLADASGKQHDHKTAQLFAEQPASVLAKEAWNE